MFLHRQVEESAEGFSSSSSSSSVLLRLIRGKNTKDCVVIRQAIVVH
jgi:NifU-like protein involved in Fe-S cluster formation